MNRLAAFRRARGWSQPELIKALETQAKLERVQLGASRASLKTRVSKWENGHAVPDDFYRGLLCNVFGVTEDELGFSDSAGPVLAPPVAGLVPSLAVTPEVIGFLETVFTQYTHADRMLGPRAVIGVVREQCRMIENLVVSAREPVRRDLLQIGAKFFEFGGWLAQDSGDFDAAASWSSRALDMAYETGNTRLVSYIFMRRSNVATDAGNHADGLGLAHAALRDGAQLGPGLRTLGFRQQAAALALAGDERGCARAIGDAMESVNAGGEIEPLALYCTPSYVQMEGAACWNRLGRPDRAVTMLTEALDSWPDHDQRDRGICVSRLATAHALAGSLDEACVVARNALEILTSAPSARAIAELTKLRTRLAPWRGHHEVAEVTELLRTIA